jgi:uncharacterized SAM-binding protein YcdF (DUF218 family)
MEFSWLFLRKIIEQFVFPPGLFLVIIFLIFLFSLFKKRKTVLWISFLFLIFIYFFSSWIGEFVFLKPLEESYPPFNCQSGLTKLDGLKNPVIVILAGGMVEESPAGGSFGAEIGEVTLARLYGGFKIYQKRNCDIWVSGGIAPGDNRQVPIAKVMKEVLISWGVKPNKIILEEKSRTTLENAEYTLEKLKEKRYQEIILVTSALHIKRSVQSFQNKWLKIIPAPVNYIFEKSPVNIINYFPNRESLDHNSRALHEWIGIIYYGLGLK